MFVRPAVRRILMPFLGPVIDKPAMQEVWESPVPYSFIARQLQGDGMALMAGLGLTAVGAVGGMACLLATGAMSSLTRARRS